MDITPRKNGESHGQENDKCKGHGGFELFMGLGVSQQFGGTFGKKEFCIVGFMLGPLFGGKLLGCC